MCLIIHRSPLTYNSSPLLLQMGMLKLIDTNAKMLTQQLESHDVQTLDDGTSLDAEDIEPIRMSISRLCQIKRFNDAAKLALFINHPIEQNKIGTLALFHFEVEFAIDFYLSIGDASMVNALKQIVHIDERNLLAARIAVLLEDFDLAQDYFMKSSYKIGALELRKDLLQWESALKLAKILNPSDLPYISRSYATQLEAHGDIPAAYKFYEKGITKRSDDREHDEYCAGGIARCALRIGDFRRGIGLCLKLPSKQLKRDCAAILAKMKKFAEAGEIYEKAEAWDKAAECYIHSKNWNGVGQLLNKITSPRIHYLYGEAREREGHYDEAFQAYLHANEDEQAVRIQLDYLNNPEKAGEIVQRKMNTDAARRVAKYYEERKDYPSALKFLIFSRKNEEAFNLAKKNHRMDDLSELILDHGSRDDYFSIALYFEQQNRNYQSGKFYYYAEEYDKAVDHLLKNDPKHQDEAIEFAIKAVGASQNPHLADVVLQYLEGVIDGTPKPTKYKFLLYSALHRYSEAAEAAVLIGREDMNDGQYKMAHDVLRTMYQTLKQQRIHVPREMVNNLSLLHSYRLAKLHAKKGNHLIAARLLDRVSKNISKFEQHSVQIMTSTVIECSKVGLKDTALKYAAILVRPENKKHIDQRFQRKIETLVRRPEKGDIPMEKSNCPICSYPLGDYELLCNECQSSIPYCIASGKHILNSDLTVCPQCDFPAIYSHFVPLLTTDHECPMCNGIIDIRMVKQIDDQELIRHIISPDVENESSN
ncbi:hypothetical protein SNEBB_003676 [Seison nebaliae]|nr:hypothetical protein SNEBB_003676 [Seison nebaliae]